MMKKTLLFIAVAMLFCTGMKAQDLACAFKPDNSFQLSLSEQPQTTPSSIYSLPMPATDFATGNQFNTQQYASSKGWGIACVVSGGVIMLTGAYLWLFGGIFSNTTNHVANMQAAMDADMAANMAANMDASSAAEMAANMENTQQDPTLQKVDNAGKVIKTVGIVGTATGAVLVGTGIVLLTSNGGGGYSRGKSNAPHRTRRKGPARSNPRHAELMPDNRDMQPEWSLCLNVGPASAGLTLAF